jgi:hypothetical protein
MSSSVVRERARARSSLIALAVVVISVVAPATAARAGRGAFVTSCDYSHSLKDDPIVFPGQPGASHMHDFFGNKSTDASSTVGSLRSATTKCLLQSDTAPYWTPTAYLDDAQITPDRVRAYYFGISKGGVETIPRGFQMLAGNKLATTRSENPHVGWFCGAAQKIGTSTPLSSHPYDCTRYLRKDPFVDGIVAKIVFANCWDGTGTAPIDVAYADHGCPDGFTHVLPRLILRVHYGIMDPCAGATPCRANNAPDENIHLTLSSGSYFTYHADFWNAWHQRRLDHLVSVCLDAHIDCGGQRS